MEYKHKKLYLTLSHAGYEAAEETAPWGLGVRDLYIIHYVISGSGYFECDGKKHRITAGQSFLIVPSCPIFYYPDKNDPWEYTWVNFYGAQAKSLLAKCSLSRKNPVTGVHKNFPTEYFYELVKSYTDLTDAAVCRNQAILQLIIAWYIENYPNEHQKDSDELLHLAAQTVEENFHKSQFNVEQLANILNVSRTTLYRLFVKGFNTPPQKYIALRRAEKAELLLKNTELSVKAIAYSVGFEDQLTFSKFFKNQIGTSPQNYRKPM